jgi:hypothetical protein
MPVEFYVILGLCVAVMGFSAFYLGDEDRTTRGFARVGLVLGGSALFVSVLYYMTILAALLVVCIPIALVMAWWNGLF